MPDFGFDRKQTKKKNWKSCVYVLFSGTDSGGTGVAFLICGIDFFVQ